jgi:hypothetical protein
MALGACVIDCGLLAYYQKSDSADTAISRVEKMAPMRSSHGLDGLSSVAVLALPFLVWAFE